MDKLYAFEVKRASEEDIPAIIKITKDAFLKYCEMAGLSYDIEALNETYDDVKHDIETKEVYVVFIDNEPIGAVRIELQDNNEAYLSRFAVKSSERNNGIGKTLMNVVDSVMRENGVKYLRRNYRFPRDPSDKVLLRQRFLHSFSREQPRISQS